MTENRFKEVMLEMGISQDMVDSFWTAKPPGVGIDNLDENDFRELMMGNMKNWKIAEQILKELKKQEND